ncbi:DUF3419 family protein [Fredinandcohnia sp. 179-A 10B2 NHS]|uniref:DUF3419 family protein n=1 Tax=Fredinandcohnia sp. 179-A 10B2 NHS TaxID=3235176 RepID=UPI00399F8A51
MFDLFFSQIREDSLVEREISSIENPKKLVVVGSGGCTAFSLLKDDIKEVICVDYNPAQCALIELKKIAIQHLGRQEYLAFIGETPDDRRIETFRYLEQYLQESTRNYWEHKSESIQQGINHCGVNERFYRFIGENICRNLYDESIWKLLFESRDLGEQIAFYEKYLTTLEWQTTVKILLSKTTHLQFFPTFMFTNASENDFGNFFMKQFEKEVTTKQIQNNYFLSQILFSSYLYNEPEGLPYYMSEHGYEIVKRNIEKVHIYNEALHSLLQKVNSIDAFYLSNVFDWASEKDRVQICNGILEAKSTDAIVLYRNMLSTSRLPDYFNKNFIVDKKLSSYFEQLERSMLYQKVTVGRLT